MDKHLGGLVISHRVGVGEYLGGLVFTSNSEQGWIYPSIDIWGACNRSKRWSGVDEYFW